MKLKSLFKKTLRFGFLFIINLLVVQKAFSQCQVNNLTINTGRIGVPHTAIPNGNTDPNWIILSRSGVFGPTIPAGTPINAVVVPPAVGVWNTQTNAGWICDQLNNASVTAAPNIDTNANMVIARRFRTCETANLTFTLSILVDNFISAIRLDGTTIAGFSSPIPGGQNWLTPWTITFTRTSVAPGNHTLEFVVEAWPDAALAHNPAGLSVAGTITTTNPIIVNNMDPNCANFTCCDEQCYWKLDGNNIFNNRNIFGTLSNHDVRIQTAGANRGILTNTGRFGWNTSSPTALFDVNCNTTPATAGASDIRFRNLQTTTSSFPSLVIDPTTGYVYNSNTPVGGNDWTLNGNTISSTNYLGTINNEDIRFRTYFSQPNSVRMIIKGSPSNNNNIADPMAGFVGINTLSPTARLHINCNDGNANPGNPNTAGLSDVRFQNLEVSNNDIDILGIDNQGYVFNTGKKFPLNTTWNVGGNAFSSNKIFGTLSPHDVEIQTSGIQRGVFDQFGNFGWNLQPGNMPSTYLHIDANGANVPPLKSGIRFENLQTNEGDIMVIDHQGYVFNSGQNISQLKDFTKNLCPTADMVTKTDASGNLVCSQIFDDPSGSGVGIGSTGPFTYTPGLFYNGTASPGGTVALDVAGITQSLEYIATSDRNYKSNITAIKNPFAIINNLNGKTYTWNQKAKTELKADNGKHYGFIAQEVGEIMPEAVIVNEKGRYGVNYNAFIPVLTEGQKELYKMLADEKAKNAILQNELNELKDKVNTLLQSKVETKVDIITPTHQNELYQNNPNPFGTETSISYSITNMHQNAFIAIYDLNGKELYKYAIEGKGKGSITVSGEQLVPGIYLYSLIIDGKETDTKRMVVSK
ncbi:hypothetical protein CAP35_14730 [Chitinophagaceae bacterium IBVUCB1]|nr:hypothetical protein CAP35_14730 [Chitinophagaceae bacterium IBVUCB1]